MWSFRPHYRQLQRLYLAGRTQGESCSPHIRRGAQPVPCSLCREWQSRTQPPPVAPALLYIFPVEVLPFTGPSAMVFPVSLPRPLYWGERRNFKDIFPHSDSVFNTFSLLALPSLLLWTPGSIKWPEPFVQGSLSSETPSLCWCTWPSAGAIPRGRMVGKRFPLFSLMLMLLWWFKAWWLLSFWFVVLRGCSDTCRLAPSSSVQPLTVTAEGYIFYLC